MASPPSFGLGDSTNHSLRDVGKAEPIAEVDRPIASQGIEIDLGSLFELSVTQNPHNDARTWGCGLKTEDTPVSSSRSNYGDERLYDGANLSSKANPMRMDTPDNANSFVQRGTWRTDNPLYDSASVQTVRPEIHSEIRRRSDSEVRHSELIELGDMQERTTNYVQSANGANYANSRTNRNRQIVSFLDR